ncbi:diacylglycerol kinase [Malaciobacter marinus]|jgi:diacylglycerol kinase (ATP)|uniref:diacylglycerol kinase n=1 Tax=Malaciobacter marinus TaxID=505249 RepID=UPI0009A5AE1D|nr:diacylglycerol kinase [Malaciobacter marinus]SKB47344.1 diacylglycerol kinase [Malaciobacter marinus]
MRNQPKYNLFKNTSYAIDGLKDILKNETSFKIELLCAFIFIPIIFYIDTSLTNKLLMFITFSGVLLSEVINSAIERTVDLVTLDFNPMAKKAKDVGSLIVFSSISICTITWSVILYKQF